MPINPYWQWKDPTISDRNVIIALDLSVSFTPFCSERVPGVKNLVRGVWLTRAGEYMEQVQLPSISFELLVSWDGTEVIRQRVPAGKRFGLRPADEWTALECFYVLEGQALWENGHESVELGPGDSLNGVPVREPSTQSRWKRRLSLWWIVMML